MKRFAVLALISLLLLSSIALLPAPARAAETITNVKIGMITLTEYKFNEYPNSFIENWKIDTSVFDANAPSYSYTNVTEYINESGLVIDAGAYAEGHYFFPVAQVYDAFFEFNLSFSGSGQADIFLEHFWGSLSKKYLPVIGFTSDKIYPALELVGTSINYPITYPATIKIYLGYFNHTYKIWVNDQFLYENTTFATDYPYIGPPISHIDMRMRTFTSDGGEVILRSLKVYKPRYTITPMPIKFIAPSFDGPHSDPITDARPLMNLTMQYGGRGTIFYDINYNVTVTQYYLDRGWELGIHFTKKLSDLTYENATATIDSEYENITERFPSEEIHFFVALGNSENITHASYAWQKYQIMARIEAFEGDYACWEAFNDRYEQIIKAIHAGANVYFYTHGNNSGLPSEGVYDISEENYTKILQAAKQNGYLILPWYEAYMITRNTHEFYATNIQRGDGYLKFTAHTNGYKAWVDVAYTATANTVVKDLTTGKIINWQKGSVQFWVEDGHTYEIYEDTSGAGGAGDTTSSDILASIGDFVVQHFLTIAFAALALLSLLGRNWKVSLLLALLAVVSYFVFDSYVMQWLGEVDSVDFTAITLFLLSSFLFAMFVAFILRFVVFRYINILGLGAVPYFAWAILIVIIIAALQFAGIPISQYYAQFFKWLADELKHNPFVIFVMEAIG